MFLYLETKNVKDERKWTFLMMIVEVLQWFFLYHKHFDTGEQNYASYTQGDPRQTLSFQNAFSGNDNFSLF